MGKAPSLLNAVNMQENSRFAQKAAQLSHPPPTYLQNLLRAVICVAL